MADLVQSKDPKKFSVFFIIFNLSDFIKNYSLLTCQLLKVENCTIKLEGLFEAFYYVF